MATFSVTWNVTFESQPADVEDASLGALRIRTLKSAISERLKVDHSWAGDGNDGKHKKLSLPIQTGDPTLDTGDGALYTKQVNGRTELFYKDSNGTVIRLTASGLINVESFPANSTFMFFLMPAAPAGWTMYTAIHDRVLRLVNGVNEAGNSQGGTWQITGMSVTVAGHALTVAEMPQHRHTIGQPFLTPGSSNGLGSGGSSPFGGTLFTDFQGGNAAHGHPGSTVSQDATWRPAYQNCIVCFKNQPVGV